MTEQNPYQSPATSERCPDCGAPLRPEDGVCWLCMRRRLRPVNPNQGGVLTVLGFVAALVMIGPASLVAFVVVCTASGGGRPVPAPSPVGWVLSFIAAGFVACVFLAVMIRQYKRL